MQEKTRFIIERISFAIFLFTAFAGLYIIGNAWFHPETLSLQLTHHTPWIREDDFGIIAWMISFTSFLLWNLIRK